jgi:hypothetical protein
MLDAGHGLFLRTEEVIAIQDGTPTDEEIGNAAIFPLEEKRGQHHRCVILLRGGQTLIGYDSASRIAYDINEEEK